MAHRPGVSIARRQRNKENAAARPEGRARESLTPAESPGADEQKGQCHAGQNDQAIGYLGQSGTIDHDRPGGIDEVGEGKTQGQLLHPGMEPLQGKPWDTPEPL